MDEFIYPSPFSQVNQSTLDGVNEKEIDLFFSPIRSHMIPGTCHFWIRIRGGIDIRILTMEELAVISDRADLDTYPTG
jgi:hypothetical protein